MARGYIRQLVLNGVLTPGSRIDAAEIAQKLKISAVPVREALIRLSERQFIQGGSRQTYRIGEPSQAEQLAVLSWAQVFFEKAIAGFLQREDRAFLISTIQVAAAEKDGLHATVFCFRIADAIGSVGLSEIEYLLFSITLDYLLLTPPIDCEPDQAALKLALTAIIDLIVDNGSRAEIERQIRSMSAAMERIIVAAHTQTAADLLFKDI